MIRIVRETVDTLRMNNLNRSIILDIVESEDFKTFIKNLYKKENDYLSVSVDICQALNEMTPRSVIARPLYTTDNIVFEVYGNIYTIYNKKYTLEESNVAVTPSDNYYSVKHYIESDYIERLGDR